MLVLSYKPDVTVRDIAGQSPLHYAVMVCHFYCCSLHMQSCILTDNGDAVEALIKAGVDLELRDGFGRTPLTLALEPVCCTKP